MRGTCVGCGVDVTLDVRGGWWVDADGDAHCERRYDDCRGCEDGEPHPHWVEDD